MGRFEVCLPRVLRHEGGEVNDRHDPGGHTNMGVTQGTLNAWRRLKGLPRISVSQLTFEERDAIYRFQYWDKCRCDELPAGVDYAVFDAAVNSGPGRGARWIQRAVGVEADGAVGAITIAAAKEANPVVTINRMLDDRMNFLRSLKHWWRFKNGWTRRVREVRADALEDAANVNTSPRTDIPTEPTAKAPETAVKPDRTPEIVGGILTTALTGVGGLLGQAQDAMVQLAMLVLFAGILVAGAIWYLNRRKEKAI